MKNGTAKYSAIIIDDEPKAIAVLRKLLEIHCPQVDVIASLLNSTEALEKIKILNPSIVFLDIEMPQMNGFQLLDNLKEINFHLIITSAYGHYAAKAFRFNAVDYLIKPVDPEELKNALEKVAAKTFLFTHQIQRISDILHESEKEQLPQRIAFPHAKGYKFITLKDIIFCESESNYTFLHLAGEPKFAVCKTLGEIEEMLSHGPFLRIHRSFLVNTRRIKEFIKSDGGFLIMDNRFEIPVSRHKREELGEILKLK